MTARIPSLSAAEARRIGLAAQGFGTARSGPVTGRTLAATVRRLGVLQIDSVNVFARSHYLPAFSRLGAYDPAVLDRLIFSGRGPFTEYWAHMASAIPVTDWGLFAFRMADFRERYADEWGGFFAQSGDIIDWVRAELTDRGPMRPAEFGHELQRGRRGAWWDWDVVKRALELLWRTGDVAIAGRRGFERRYGLAEQVIPDAARIAVPRDEAIRELLDRAARAYGVATAADLADYWRLTDRAAVHTAIGELVDAGELVEVRVEGWERGDRPLPAWRHRSARLPRAVSAQTLLSPFDPTVWHRERGARLFGFDYRIEIYVPAAKRRFGYYSLPVLLDDQIAGRVDLKADRTGSRLLVQSAWWEPGRGPTAPERVAEVLRQAAAWQGLETISVSRWGDAVDDVAAALGDAARHG